MTLEIYDEVDVMPEEIPRFPVFERTGWETKITKFKNGGQVLTRYHNDKLVMTCVSTPTIERPTP